MSRTKTTAASEPEDRGHRNFARQLKKRLDQHKKNRKNRRRRRVARSHPTQPRAKVQYFTPLNMCVAISFFAMCIIIGYVYTLTAGVYVDAFADFGSSAEIVQISLGSESVSQWPVIGPVVALPVRFAEWVVNSWETNSYGLLGLVAFIILQTLELLPTVVWESPALILHLISKLEKVRSKTAVYKTDSEFIRRLKARHNQYYDDIIQGLDDAKLIAFGADILICFLVVKFVVLDRQDNGAPVLGTFFEGMAKFDFGWHKLDPMATFKVFSSLFLLFILVKLGMRIFNGFSAFAVREESQADVKSNASKGKTTQNV